MTYIAPLLIIKKPPCGTENKNDFYNILQDAQRMQEHMKKKKGEVVNYMEEKCISLEEYKVSITYFHVPPCIFDNYQILLLLFDITMYMSREEVKIKQG